MTQRDEKGRLLPGNSLNPAGGPGRPKLPEWFKERGPEALQHLVDVATGVTEADAKTRLRAAEVVVERIYGKAQESVEVTGSLGVVDQLARLVVAANTSSTGAPAKGGDDDATG